MLVVLADEREERARPQRRDDPPARLAIPQERFVRRREDGERDVLVRREVLHRFVVVVERDLEQALVVKLGVGRDEDERVLGDVLVAGMGAGRRAVGRGSGETDDGGAVAEGAGAVRVGAVDFGRSAVDELGRPLDHLEKQFL